MKTFLYVNGKIHWHHLIPLCFFNSLQYTPPDAAQSKASQARFRPESTESGQSQVRSKSDNNHQVRVTPAKARVRAETSHSRVRVRSDGTESGHRQLRDKSAIKTGQSKKEPGQGQQKSGEPGQYEPEPGHM